MLHYICTKTSIVAISVHQGTCTIIVPFQSKGREKEKEPLCKDGSYEQNTGLSHESQVKGKQSFSTLPASLLFLGYDFP